ncbi:MAG: hypothetical protein ACRESP_12520, partial [Pseudomonas sp.]
VASTICVVVYDYDFYGYDEPNPDMHHQIFTERLDEYAFVTKLKLVVVEEGDISFSVRKYNEIYGWADIIETYSLI